MSDYENENDNSNLLVEAPNYFQSSNYKNNNDSPPTTCKKYDTLSESESEKINEIFGKITNYKIKTEKDYIEIVEKHVNLENGLVASQFTTENGKPLAFEGDEVSLQLIIPEDIVDENGEILFTAGEKIKIEINRHSFLHAITGNNETQQLFFENNKDILMHFPRFEVYFDKGIFDLISTDEKKSVFSLGPNCIGVIGIGKDEYLMIFDTQGNAKRINLKDKTIQITTSIGPDGNIFTFLAEVIQPSMGQQMGQLLILGKISTTNSLGLNKFLDSAIQVLTADDEKIIFHLKNELWIGPSHLSGDGFYCLQIKEKRIEVLEKIEEKKYKTQYSYPPFEEWDIIAISSLNLFIKLCCENYEKQSQSTDDKEANKIHLISSQEENNSLKKEIKELKNVLEQKETQLAYELYKEEKELKKANQKIKELEEKLKKFEQQNESQNNSTQNNLFELTAPSAPSFRKSVETQTTSSFGKDESIETQTTSSFVAKTKTITSTKSQSKPKQKLEKKTQLNQFNERAKKALQNYGNGYPLKIRKK